MDMEISEGKFSFFPTPPFVQPDQTQPVHHSILGGTFPIVDLWIKVRGTPSNIALKQKPQFTYFIFRHFMIRKSVLSPFFPKEAEPLDLGTDLSGKVSNFICEA